MIKPLSEDESLAVLRQIGYGRLALVTPEGPYAVPMLFRVDERTLVFYTLPGRKLDALRQHPSGVTMEVDDIDSTSAWRSVMVVGRFEEESVAQREGLEREFATRRQAYARVALAALVLPDATFGRLTIEQLSGRTMQP
ncbi:MAG: pyridoxamine 5'-phosphate oxidase family protein [Chloroflexota bacterium]